MLDIAGLVAQCANYYWSPQHPTTYKIGSAGIGNLLKGFRDYDSRHLYAAFNYAWVVNQADLNTQVGHTKAVRDFIMIIDHMPYQLDKRTLADLFLTCSLNSFTYDYAKYRPTIKDNVRHLLDKMYTERELQLLYRQALYRLPKIQL